MSHRGEVVVYKEWRILRALEKYTELSVTQMSRMIIGWNSRYLANCEEDGLIEQIGRTQRIYILTEEGRQWLRKNNGSVSTTR